jgi:ABC-2 type transport system permease protein
MFVWADVFFDVDFFGHLGGFLVMAVCTAAASASLALCLAATCRSRGQLNGVSTILILTMSALGGSMIPRYIMSEEMRRWGQLTFNAWAVDGFMKVFWYELPVAALTLEISVLIGMASILAGVALVLAGRWRAA